MNRRLPGGPALAQLMISHSNDSGLAMDRLTRNYFVTTVRLGSGRGGGAESTLR